MILISSPQQIMVEMTDTISFIEKLAQRHEQLIERAQQAKTERERQHWLEVAEQLDIMIKLHTIPAAA